MNIGKQIDVLAEYQLFDTVEKLQLVLKPLVVTPEILANWLASEYWRVRYLHQIQPPRLCCGRPLKEK